MLPIFYRMTRFAPPVGTPGTVEILPVRPVGDRNAEKAQAPSNSNVFSVKPNVNSIEKPIPVISDHFADSSKNTPLASPEPFHLDPIWGGHVPSWPGLPKSILIASDGTSVSEPAIEAGKSLAAHLHSSHEVCMFPAEGPFEVSRKILRRALEIRASLLVLGTHHRKGKDRVKAGSVAEVVLKEAACPVLLVSQPLEWENIHRILIPTDLSLMDYPEIAEGIRLAHRFGAEIWALHLFPRDKDASKDMEMISNKLDSLKWNVMEEREGSGQNDIANTIIEFAQEHSPELILMATHSEMIHDQILPSSVCLEVLRRTSSPLWVVHSSS